MPIPNWNKLVAEGRAVAVGVPLSEHAIRIPAPTPVSPIPKLEKPVEPKKQESDESETSVSKPEETATESEPQTVSQPEAPASKPEIKTSEMIAELKKMGIKTKFGATKEEIAAQYAEAVANAS